MKIGTIYFSPFASLSRSRPISKCLVAPGSMAAQRQPEPRISGQQPGNFAVITAVEFCTQRRDVDTPLVGQIHESNRDAAHCQTAKTPPVSGSQLTRDVHILGLAIRPTLGAADAQRAISLIQRLVNAVPHGKT